MYNRTSMKMIYIYIKKTLKRDEYVSIIINSFDCQLQNETNFIDINNLFRGNFS